MGARRARPTPSPPESSSQAMCRPRFRHQSHRCQRSSPRSRAVPAAPAVPTWPDRPVWPPVRTIDAVAAPVEPAASRAPAGAYLPPSAVLPPAEALPLPGTARTDAAANGKGDGWASLSSSWRLRLGEDAGPLGLPADLPTRVVMLGAGLAAAWLPDAMGRHRHRQWRDGRLRCEVGPRRPRPSDDPRPRRQPVRAGPHRRSAATAGPVSACRRSVWPAS